MKAKKKRICKIVNFAVPADHGIILKESEKKDKYLDLARELKKLWNMTVTIAPIVIGALGTITKGLFKVLGDLEVGGRVETIQTTALLRTARIMRRVLETWVGLLSLRLQWKTISQHRCEKLMSKNTSSRREATPPQKKTPKKLHTISFPGTDKLYVLTSKFVIALTCVLFYYFHFPGV